MLVRAPAVKPSIRRSRMPSDTRTGITRRDAIFAFHYSLDGRRWQLVRYFTLGDAPQLQAGFSAQSPTGAGCKVAFSQIHYAPTAVADLRSGD